MAEATGVISIATWRRRVTAVLAAFALLTVSQGGEFRSFAQEQARRQLNNEQINQLVAPIALYPDNLLGQVLAASTYPLEVVVAARWSAANQNMTGQALEDAMQLQSWDPSVKALTAVPQVLQMMSEKLEWTQQLGEAYLSQPDGIAAAVQNLRARADASGNLQSTKQIKVRRVAAPPPPPELIVVDPLPPEYIIIEPYEPDFLYVPIYDPWLVYGPWPYPAWRPFYWYPPGYVTVGVIGFGAPIVVGAALWANYSWYSRRVEVNVVKYNTFNKVSLANTATNQTWKFNPARNPNLQKNLQKQFGNVNPNSRTGTGQQFLNTKGTTIGNQKNINNPTVGARNLNTPNNLNTKSNLNLNKKKSGPQQGVAAFGNQNAGTGNRNLNIQKNNQGTAFRQNSVPKQNPNFKPNVTHRTNPNVHRKKQNP